MNNLAYSGQDPQKIGSQVEELLRKELGLGGPIAFEVEDAGTAEKSVGSILKDIGTQLWSGSTTRLLTLHFHIPQPRTADLDVHMNRQGVGCYAGSLLFSTVVSKKVGGEVSLDDKGQFGGDAAAAGRLNANKDLCKKCEAFAVTKGGISGFEVKLPARVFQIVPHERGAHIIAVTLPKSKSMGFSATFNSKEFFEIAAQIEALL
ncbi:MAG TPA: hypothetical protein VLT85_07395 [Terriglobales bacterium]|nr:hypothetical protein [Terriglobales bacterium]